jgi:anti-sigma regulatory factor (Ser/Thr protein kinase)/ActR/RegA family two-component response regulator
LIIWFTELPMSRILIIDDHAHLARDVGGLLSAANLPTDYAAGHADALQRLRNRSYGVVITGAHSFIDEDLALLEEMRDIRPGVKCIVLAQHTTPAEVIAALRARVFACFSSPFEAYDIANIARGAASDNEWRDDIHIISARPGWVALRVNCRLLTADRLLSFAKELSRQLPNNTREELMQALREILLNAMEHGATFNPDLVVAVTAIRTARSMVFYLRDPGTGFHREDLLHAAISNPETDPAAHVRLREKEGMRPGGYGLLLAAGIVDELIYNEIGNEVLLIKYLEPVPSTKP